MTAADLVRELRGLRGSVERLERRVQIAIGRTPGGVEWITGLEFSRVYGRDASTLRRWAREGRIRRRRVPNGYSYSVQDIETVIGGVEA